MSAEQANPYPVLAERSLARAPRKFLMRKRQIEELPTREPGTVLVFESGDGYVALTERSHLVGSEETVVDAVSVSLVSVRPRAVSVPFRLHSQSAADDFTVVATFHCRVESPEAVVEEHLTNLVPRLRGYLLQSGELVDAAVSCSVEQVAIARRNITALVEAHTQIRPPSVKGMRIELSGVSVQTPTDLADHEREMRDLGWQHRKEHREHEAEDVNASRYAGYFERGPHAVAGLAAAKNQLNLGEATERAYDQDSRNQENILAAFNALPAEVKDTIAVDADRIFGALLGRVLPPDPQRDAVQSANDAPRPELNEGPAENPHG